MLSACAALVLFAGGAWWVAAEPDLRAEPAATTPPLVAPEPVEQNPQNYLPEFPNTVERHDERMEPDTTHVLEASTERGREYRLQYACVGPGALSLRIKGTTEGEMLHHIGCEGSLGTLPFFAADTNVVVEASRPGPEPADVIIQVVAVE